MGATVSVLLVDSARTQFWPVAVEKLRRLRETAGMVGWENVRRDVLDEFCWVSVVQEDVFRTLWVEVEGLKSGRAHTNGNGAVSTTNLDSMLPVG